MSSATKKKNTTVLDKVVIAIRELKGGPKGSSRSALAKYLKSELDYDNTNAIKLALKKGVSSGVLVQTGQSFRVAADPVAEQQVEDEVQIEEIQLGKDGKESAHGDTITVSYVGTLENGNEFDRANTFKFLLGAGEVIKGWDQGMVGMRVGGKRKLVIPSKLAYGKRGSKPDIPPNATLLFTVKMKKIDK